MVCDGFLERSVQKRVNQFFSTGKNDRQILSQAHQLVGAEIWIQEDEEEKTLLEGVTKIEFREGEISLHTILGDEIRVRADIKRALLLDKGFVFEVEHSPIS